MAAPADEQGQQGESPSAAQNESRPGGGLGPPIDAPDPLQKYRWWILGGFAGVLVIGGVYVASRQQASNRVARAHAKGSPALEEDEEYEAAEVSAPQARLQPSGPRSSAKLLEALKEELFELEVEHKQGRISQQEYESAKSALDQTLQRALKRETQKS